MATVTIPKVLANFETTLASGISSSASSLSLSTSTDDDGSTLSGLYALTLDEGTSSEEHMLVTLSGASGTITRRGLSRVDMWTEQSGNKKSHNRGATVTITNSPLVLLIRLLKGTDTFNAVDWSGINSIDGLATPTTSQQAARKAYVDSVATTAGGIGSFMPTDAGGLNIDVGSGYLVTDDGIVEYAGVSGQAMTDNSTNYVMLDTDGTLVVNTTGWVASYVPIAKVTTSGGDITTLEDARGWLTSPSADRMITDDITYGDTISAEDFLYVDTADGKWKRADASAEATAAGAIGMALDAGVDTDTGKRVQTSGVITGLSGLTPGFQFLSDTAGEISSTAGTYRKLVGFAPSATTLILMPSFGTLQLSGANSDATIANFNEAMTFFANTDITGAEAETLTGGSTALGLHGNPVLLSRNPQTADDAVNQNKYCEFFDNTAPSLTEGPGTILPYSGTLSHLYATSGALSSSPDTTGTVTVRVNGSDTALTLSWAHTEDYTQKSDTTSTVNVSAGDVVTIKITGTTTQTQFKNYSVFYTPV